MSRAREEQATRYWLTPKGWAATDTTTEDTDMTEPTIEQAAPEIAAAPGSRLEQLHAAYPTAKAEADEAAARLKAITDAIKLELTQAAPEQRRVVLAGGSGPRLALVYSERWTVDSKKLKAEAPETYVRFAKKGGSWSLKAVAAGSDDNS